ncbi:DinB family protein [Terriglobus saanensis]|uniref:DinB family protein n=1 Tax=Terriglobus saanensis (strain ATCC BAA-1853 / DSM 23119 / SP1PR4) TaxID=401053 RepID=E8UYV3_TERSS|nr:DinB family protein [Terriglobus saanensis]ADV84319.1 DinB family protein [Terriglobus saanensis SP1PR4]
MATETTSVNLVTADTLLQNWQGHRRLTRKIIETFPEDKLFQFSLGGMRTFGEMAQELIGMTMPVVDGVATGKWEAFQSGKPATKSELLRLWDAQTAKLDEEFPKIPLARFWVVEKAFGQWEMPGIVMIQYAIDNEIHHRGEGYVYLRALGIEPPPFWERN